MVGGANQARRRLFARFESLREPQAQIYVSGRPYFIVFDSAQGSRIDHPLPRSVDDQVSGPNHRRELPPIISPDIVMAKIEPGTCYLSDRSRPESSFYLWSYQLTITASDNFNGVLKLIGRHWEYGNGEAPLNGATIAGEHPIITWRRPVVRYRSATAFSEPFGQMEGYILGEWNEKICRIPVGMTNFQADVLTLESGKLTSNSSNLVFDKNVIEVLKDLIYCYNSEFQSTGIARVSSRQFPQSVRLPIEDFVFKTLNNKKFSEYDLSIPLGIVGKAAEGLKFWTSDVFADESIDDVSIEFLYMDMDLAEYIKITDEFLNSEELLSRQDLRMSAERFRKELAAAQALPQNAPMKYEDRPDKSQNVIDYLRDDDGWGPYVRRGTLTRPALLQRDPRAYQALTNWLRNPRHVLPSDIKLPTKSETLMDEITDEERVREARRVLRAYERRRPPLEPT